MNKRDTTQDTLAAAGLTLMVVLGAWSLPALASSSVVVECEEEAETMTALVHTSSQTVADVKNDSDDAVEEDAVDEGAEEDQASPAVTTSLPGVSESVLPGFRRQMLRTDI